MGAECDPRFTSTIFHYLYVEKQNAILLSALTCFATLLAIAKFGSPFAGEPRVGVKSCVENTVQMNRLNSASNTIAD